MTVQLSKIKEHQNCIRSKFWDEKGEWEKEKQEQLIQLQPK